jgi:hypothetical protein
VGTCRPHPFIEGKLPLSPKAVEPPYEEAWVPQDPPQRPGNGLIPKAQRRPRPSKARTLATRAQMVEKNPHLKLPVLPLPSPSKLKVPPPPSKLKMHGRLIKTVRIPQPQPQPEHQRLY